MIYINKIRNVHVPVPNEVYPYSIPCLRGLKELEFRNPVTFFVGENGSGKSTLIEAIAINAGFNPEGGSKNFNFKTQDTHSELYKDIRLTRSYVNSYAREKDGYFMRAESMYNLATEIDNLEKIDPGLYASYGDKSLHKNSHGESFMKVFLHRFGGNGLYIFDEPEAALSISSLFALLIRMKELEKLHSQFIIATHSPVLLAYPGADIYAISDKGIELTDYEDTAPYQLTKYFINNYRKVLEELFEDVKR